jgi:hypothetical protein
MNYFDQNAAPPEEDFNDQPDEVAGTDAAPVDVASAAPTPRRPTTPVVQLPQDEQYEEEEAQQEEPQDYAAVLSDARLRLEQGRLYEMILNQDIFDGIDADQRAVQSVQKEIKAYAQERMEIMLGMRQEKSTQETVSGFPAELFPFNSLEVKVLKDLASAATKGASREADPIDLGPQAPPARTTLNKIGSKAQQTRPVAPKVQPKPLQARPTTPVPRKKIDATVQQILEEEGVTLDQVNEVFDPRKRYLTQAELDNLTPEQVIERNKVISNKNKSVPSRSALPMPSAEQIEMVLTQRAQVAAAHPQMQQIMGLLDKAQKKG